MSGKPTTPVSSPQIPKVVKLSGPTTPPSQKKQQRLSASFLNTPEQNVDHLPFSPGLKRTNSGSYKSPDYKLNPHNAQSPYSNLLKTPRHSGYESDDGESARFKLQKTPQYFSPGKKLFDDSGSKAKEDLSEITSQLKGKLTSALDKLQKSQSRPSRFDFTELSFNSDTSPTKKIKHSAQRDLSKEDSIQRANINLQQLTHPIQTGANELQTSPIIDDPSSDRLRELPSPDEESSAHNALMAALSRQRKSGDQPSNGPQTLPHVHKKEPKGPGDHEKYHLPPLNMALNEYKDKNTEQDAVLSLMSLSSPQSVKFTHSRTQSLNNNSPVSSRSSSVILPSPSQQAQPPPNLPPISHLMSPTRPTNDDNDATDVEEETTDDDTET